MLFAVSVTTNSTVRPSPRRFRLPACTMPPTRNARSFGASPAATCDGLKKNTRFDWKALSTSAAATASAATPATMIARRLCRGFTCGPFGAVERLQPRRRGATPRAHDKRLDDQAERGHRVTTPHVGCVSAHGEELGCAPPVHAAASSWTQPACRSRSRMIARTRASATAIEYIQNANTMTIMPTNITAAIDGARVTLTEAPWWSVFHHCTEK